ncbi:MAG: hypothetical protein ACRDSJ_05340 [Rubrobacteraceae bacterium]
MLVDREDLKEVARAPLLGEGFSFDELTRGVASGEITRSRALKMAGAAAFGAALIPFAAAPADAKKKKNKCKGKRKVSDGSCPTINSEDDLCAPLTDTEFCVCAKLAKPRKGKPKTACINLEGEVCPVTDECDKNGDCASGEVCIEVGGCCGSPNNLCAAKC